jgi:hypothetical protein
VAHDALYHDPEAARFYDLENGWRSDFDFCVRTGEECILGARSRLRHWATDRRHFAKVESARSSASIRPNPMLEIARERPGGDNVTIGSAGDARDMCVLVGGSS